MTKTTTIKDDDSRLCTCRCFLSINHTNYKIKCIKIEFTNKIHKVLLKIIDNVIKYVVFHFKKVK